MNGGMRDDEDADSAGDGDFLHRGDGGDDADACRGVARAEVPGVARAMVRAAGLLAVAAVLAG